MTQRGAVRKDSAFCVCLIWRKGERERILLGISGGGEYNN